jgi:hypothetical protein
MKITLPYVVALVIKGEGSKTPVIVLPHEVDILKSLHGEDAIEVTEVTPPIKESIFETEDEYQRCQQYYKGGVDNPNPTRSVFRNLDDFESAFAGAVGEDKKALVQEAKELGIKATMSWGVDKLKEAIAEAKGE